jgi:DHA1 family tetracycline resistance protein-like MFS transporter
MEETTSPAAAPTRAAGKAAFAFIFVTVALDMLALGVMAPVLPRLVIQFEGGDVSRASEVVGLFGFVWAAMQFLAAPVLGAISDRVGRRPVVLLSNVGLGLDYVMMALAPSLGWLLAGRVISGITSSSYATAGAYIADVTPAERRAARFGMLGAAFGLGFIIGPAVGGVLGDIDLRLPFWGAAALSLANATYGFFILPESLPPERRTRGRWRLASPFSALRLFRSHVELAGLAATYFLYWLAHEVNPTLFVLYAGYRYGWDASDVGLALALIGVASTIVSATIVGRVVARIGERRALAVGLISGAVGAAACAFAWSSASFIIGFLLGALMSLSSPSMQALLTRRVGAEEQGRLQGALASVQGVALMIGPILFSRAFAGAIRPGATIRLPGAPYYIAAALLGGSAMVAWRATRGSMGVGVVDRG